MTHIGAHRKSWLIAMAVSSSISLAACSGGAATGTSTSSVKKEQVVSFWSSGPTPGVAHVVSAFNKKYSGKYKVVYKPFPYNNEAEFVNSALSAHRGPDLLEESLTTSAPYISEGLVVPITPILKMAGINPSVDFPQSMWKGTSLNGTHYVAPNGALPTVLFYNKALFTKAGLNPSQPPTTGAQLVADAQKITKTLPGVWGYVQEPAWPNPFEFPSLLAQYGGKEANANTRKVLFGSPAGIKALQFEYNLIYKYHVSPTNASTNEAHNLFVKGTNAMEMTGLYDYPIYKKALGSSLGMTLLPVIGKRQADFLGQNYWWVMKSPTMSAAKQHAIAAFMKYYYGQSMYLAQQGQFPTWQPTIKTSAFQSLPTYALQTKAVHYGILNPLIPSWGTTTTKYLYQDVDLALLGHESPAAALAKAATQTQAALKSLPG